MRKMYVMIFLFLTIGLFACENTGNITTFENTTISTTLSQTESPTTSTTTTATTTTLTNPTTVETTESNDLVEMLADDEAFYASVQDMSCFRIVQTLKLNIMEGNSIYQKYEMEMDMNLDLLNNYMRIVLTENEYSLEMIIEEYEERLLYSVIEDNIVSYEEMSDMEESFLYLEDFGITQEETEYYSFADDLQVSKMYGHVYEFRTDFSELLTDEDLEIMLGSGFEDMFDDIEIYNRITYDFDDFYILYYQKWDEIRIPETDYSINISITMKIQFKESIYHISAFDRENCIYPTATSLEDVVITMPLEETKEVLLMNSTSNYLRYELTPGVYSYSYTLSGSPGSIQVNLVDDSGESVNMYSNKFVIEDEGYYYLMVSSAEEAFVSFTMTDLHLEDIVNEYDLSMVEGNIIGTNEGDCDISYHHFSDSVEERILMVFDMRLIDEEEYFRIELGGYSCNSNSDYCYFALARGNYVLAVSGSTTGDYDFPYHVVTPQGLQVDPETYPDISEFDEWNPLFLTVDEPNVIVILTIEAGVMYSLDNETYLVSSYTQFSLDACDPNSMPVDLSVLSEHDPPGIYTIEYTLDEGYHVVIIPIVTTETTT